MGRWGGERDRERKRGAVMNIPLTMSPIYGLHCNLVDAPKIQLHHEHSLSPAHMIKKKNLFTKLEELCIQYLVHQKMKFLWRQMMYGIKTKQLLVGKCHNLQRVGEMRLGNKYNKDTARIMNKSHVLTENASFIS